MEAAALGMAAQSVAAPALLLFGGTDHKTFLGCLNCSATAADSVGNSYGTYGSAYTANSIFNHYGAFGSAYSDSSPCDSYATDPPVIVGTDGTFYGRLTLNPYNTQLGIGVRFATWLKAVCAA